MLQIAADKPLVKRVNSVYAKRLLEYNDFKVNESIGTLFKVQGFDNYNQLLNINSMFSNNPRFDPVDRTGLCLGPIRYAAERPWKIPACEISLEQALQLRVEELCRSNQKINLLWSGGIDSTTIVVAFLKFAPDIRQCRIVYSPWSTYEHPKFYKLLQSRTDIEMLDISGESYLTLELDGVIVSGNSSDEIHASIDQSFFEQYGYDFLFTPWKDFFYSKLPDDKFIDFCQQHFSASGKDIVSVLDARWWFYASSKLTSILNIENLAFFASFKNFNPERLIGFFDCDCYERYIYFNVDKIMSSDSFATWRQFLKDFCYQYDGFDDWRINKSKFNSSQMQIYTDKKQILNDARSLMILADGHRVATPNLPLFSQHEWNNIKQDYQHVFRQPDKV